VPALCARSPDLRDDPFPDQVSLELGDCGQDVEERSPRRRDDVHGLATPHRPARVFARLCAISGVRRWQVGDREVRGIFLVEALAEVARLIQARQLVPIWEPAQTPPRPRFRARSIAPRAIRCDGESPAGRMPPRTSSGFCHLGNTADGGRGSARQKWGRARQAELVAFYLMVSVKVLDPITTLSVAPLPCRTPRENSPPGGVAIW